jgi:hypothetical protein
LAGKPGICKKGLAKPAPFLKQKRGKTQWVFPALSPKKTKPRFAFFAN